MENSSDKILDKIINVSQAKERDQITPRDVVESLLALISEREGNILRSRYGLDLDNPKTLEAIGKKLNLTRERVRQIENQAIKNILRHKDYHEIVSPFRHLISSIIEDNGGLISLEELVHQIFSLLPGEDTKDSLIKFLITNFSSGANFEVVTNEHYKTHLRCLDLQAEVIDEILTEIENILNKQKSILEESELLKMFRNSEYYNSQKEKLMELIKDESKLNQALLSYLEASNKFERSPFKQYGLSNWPEIVPRRINGKIYLALLAKKEPLHFNEIADVINEAWVDARDVKNATVHNELIFDPRFVLVGRGRYGLKDWGYESGSVEKVIETFLHKASEPQTVDQIINYVKSKKLVKDATIKLILKNSDKFVKTNDDRYFLVTE